MRNPKSNNWKDSPQELLVIIASFLLPREMWDLQVAMKLPKKEAIVDDASKLTLQSLRKKADKFWGESSTIHMDKDLSILEELVANDPSPLANQLHIARESLPLSYEDIKKKKQ